MIDKRYLDHDNRLHWNYFVDRIGKMQGVTLEEWYKRKDAILEAELPFVVPMRRSQCDDVLMAALKDNSAGAWRSWADDGVFGLRFELEEDAVFVRLMIEGPTA